MMMSRLGSTGLQESPEEAVHLHALEHPLQLLKRDARPAQSDGPPAANSRQKRTIQVRQRHAVHRTERIKAVAQSASLQRAAKTAHFDRRMPSRERKRGVRRCIRCAEQFYPAGG